MNRGSRMRMRVCVCFSVPPQTRTRRTSCPCTRTPRCSSRSRVCTLFRTARTARRSSSRAARRGPPSGTPSADAGSPRYTRPGIARIRVCATPPAPCASGWARRCPACTSPRAWAHLVSARSTRRSGPGSRGSRWRCLCRRRCGPPCRLISPDSLESAQRARRSCAGARRRPLPRIRGCRACRRRRHATRDARRTRWSQPWFPLAARPHE
mmetsp:Transcript_7780/g.32480  ORF Transcript_7780/g.32480 Transcript_7780/m.32480 type:complete len:210 (+) Transcript_7780:324-953(+)